jgi:cytochrome c-type biogenesis protein CcmH
LRATLPPDSADLRIIDSNIAEDKALAGSAPAVAAVPAKASAAELSGEVTLDQRFAGRVVDGTTLFIYAKAADSPGPPLAVMRTVAGSWPVSFHLDDSMAMLPSRRISQFDNVVVEARISRTGQATPSSGDLYATSPVLHPGAKKLVLVINHEIS